MGAMVEGLIERIDAEEARVLERDAVVRAWAARPAVETLHQLAERAPTGALRGYTLGVKDIIDTADLPTECGSGALAGRRPHSHAACVALARAAGAVVTGKTVTTEFAMLTPAATRNPHNLEHTPGGSSSGSAAAVADGMVRVALGTQTAGSVIRPASFCGVFGLKATHDLVPLAGVHLFSPSLDALGWFARTVDDLAAVLAALAPGGPRPRPLNRPPHIALYRPHEWDRAEPASRNAVEHVAEQLARAGASVEELPLQDAFAPLVEAQGRIMLAEGAVSMAWERATLTHELSPGLLDLLEQGDRVTAEAYSAAQHTAEAARARHAELPYDALLVPAAAGEAPAGLHATGDPLFNRPWTLLGGPCLCLPAGSGPGGLPVGVQLVGRRWEDAHLLAVASWAAEALSLRCDQPASA